MRISTDTYALSRAFGDEGAVYAAKKAGFDAIDYSFYAEHDMLGDDWESRAHNLRRVLDGAGMVCNQAHAPMEFDRSCCISGNDRAYLRLQRAIRFAAILGAPHIVIHSIGTEQDGDFWEFNRKFFSSFSPLCLECGIRIALENLYFWDDRARTTSGIMADPAQLESFTRSLPGNCFCNVVDLVHASITGHKPEAFIREMHGDMVCGLHVHDGDYLQDLHTIPGLGMFDWDAIVSALKEINYRGDLTLEAILFLKSFPAEDMELALELAARSVKRLREKF